MIDVKWNGDSARFYRRICAKRTPDGFIPESNTRLGRLSATETSWPTHMPPLTDVEVGQVQRKFFAKAPAKLEENRLKKQRARIKAASTSIKRMTEASVASPIDSASLKGLLQDVLRADTDSCQFLLGATAATASLAASAAAAGRFGTRPEKPPLKSTDIYRLWSEISGAVERLKHSLQAHKWVDVRTGTKGK